MTENEIKWRAESVITSALIAACIDFTKESDIAETEDGKALLYMLKAAFDASID